MPRLVARQWQALNPSAATVHTSGRPQWPAMRALFARSPSYSQKTMPHKKVYRQIVPPQNSAIIIPASVPNTQPADVIRLVKPVPPKFLEVDPFCVILLTPSFTPWLLRDDTFVQNVLLKAYNKLRISIGSKPPRINVLCAVVSKLPSGRAFAPGNTLGQEVLERARKAPVDETGFEGVAYATFPITASVPSSAPLREDEGALDFILDEPTADEPSNWQVVRLPLANTIFQTGTLTTMSLSVWELSHEAERLKLLSKSKISHHGIRMSARGPAIDDVVSTLSIPALPLTMPRRIEGCLGNMIRQISLGHEKNVVTASSELEEIVPMFFKSRGEPPQATTAWALIVPAAVSAEVKLRTERILAKSKPSTNVEAESKDLPWERFWQSNPPETNTLISTALAEGGRLHRVLSGGGGWGKKAGLLSLDPVPSHGTTTHSDIRESASLMGDPRDLATALTPVAQVGDFIQFFISPTAKTSEEIDQSTGLETLMGLSETNTCGWELGTIPSTIDSTSGGSWQQTTADSREIAVFRDTFGALAEGGLTITRNSSVKSTEPRSISTSTSVVDVPFSRFWAVELKESSTPSTIPVHESERRKLFEATPMQRHLSDSHLGDLNKRLITDSLHQLPNLSSRTAMSKGKQVVSQIPSGMQGSGDAIPTTPRKFARGPQIRRIMIDNPIPDRHLMRSSLFARHEPRVRKIVNENGNLDLDLAESGTELQQGLRIRRVASEDPITDRDFTKRDTEWRLASKRARGIEGMIRRLRLETRAILSASGQGLGSKGHPNKVLKRRMKVRSMLSEKSTIIIPGVAIDPPFDSRLAHDRLHQIGSAVNNLIHEHRSIMRTIRQGGRAARDCTKSEPSHHQNSKYAVPKLLSDIEPTVEDSELLISTLKRDFELICSGSSPQKVYSPVANKFSCIQVNMNVAQRELAKLLRWISLRAHITHAANGSAWSIYGLHLELRWQLGRMIRNRLPHKSIMRSEIQHLESRVFMLRDYDGNLLCNRPGIMEQQVKNYLTIRELRNPVQRHLGRMNDKRKELKKRGKVSGPLTLRPKVRKTFDTPLVHAQFTRRPIIRRERTGRSTRVHRGRRQNTGRSRHVFNRNLTRNRTPRINKKNIRSHRAMKIAEAKRKADFASRVDSWLRGEMYGIDGAGPSIEKQVVDAARLFGMSTGVSEDPERGQKNNSLGPFLDTAVRGSGGSGRKRRRR